jgi:hypothetical protein
MLLRQLQSNPETVADFDRAAEARYWEGCELVTQGRELAGVYLLGYTAEMILKHACFRTNRARPADPAAGLFGPIRNWMNLHQPLVQREAYHSLLFWMLYLRGRRRELGRPLPDPLDWELVRRIRVLYQNWSVELRYRAWPVPPEAVRAVYDHVTWLRDARVGLWS